MFDLTSNNSQTKAIELVDALQLAITDAFIVQCDKVTSAYNYEYQLDGTMSIVFLSEKMLMIMNTLHS
ncbi:hypothetical protein AB4254_11075 [Vibrio breoganii]